MAYLFRFPQRSLFVFGEPVAQARKLLVISKGEVADCSPSLREDAVEGNIYGRQFFELWRSKLFELDELCNFLTKRWISY
jgi:hypothetical protein